MATKSVLKIEEEPKVSIIVTNYNHATFLPQRIESILNQTYQGFEVIILDDNSTDDSRNVIESYSKTDARIRTVYNTENSGSPFKQWNKGVSLALGDFVWIAESDDWADSSFLENMVYLLESNPNVSIAFCNSLITDTDGKITSSTDHHDLNQLPGAPLFDSSVVNGKEFFFNSFVLYNQICNVSSAVFRKKDYLAVGGADDNMKNAGDWMLYYKMLMISDLAYLNKNLNYWRRHSNATTNNIENVRKESLLVVKECIKYQRKLGVKITKASLNSNFIWSFQRAYWIKPPFFNMQNLKSYFYQSRFDEINYLLKYHREELLSYFFNSIKNRLYLLANALKAKL